MSTPRSRSGRESEGEGSGHDDGPDDDEPGGPEAGWAEPTGIGGWPQSEPQTPEEWEQVRRSVAMLPPGAWAMRREQVLQILTTVIRLLRRTR